MCFKCTEVYFQFTLKYWFNFTKCASNILFFVQNNTDLNYASSSSVIQHVEVYLKYIWSMF